MIRPRLADRVFNRPLLVHAGKANILAPFMASEILGGDVCVVTANADGLVAIDDRHAGKLFGESGKHNPDRMQDQLVPRTKNGVGVIAIEGTLINKGAWIGSHSGETSYQGLMAQIAEARDDAAIRSVVFEIDSYGGEVAGCGDCGAAIAELSAEKPTIAILTDHAYSAAYWLASQCRQIVVPEAGGCGSIGVVTLHADYSAMLEKQGIKVTVIAAGRHKADESPYAALPDDVRETLLAEMEIIRNQFAAAVSSGRGKRFGMDAALATEARYYMGEAAVEAGLADAVARPTEAFEAFVSMF